VQRDAKAGLPVGPAAGQQSAKGGREFACAKLCVQRALRRACELLFGLVFGGLRRRVLVSVLVSAWFLVVSALVSALVSAWFPLVSVGFRRGFRRWFWFPLGFRWFPLVSAVVSAGGFGFRVASAGFLSFPPEHLDRSIWFPPPLSALKISAPVAA
jgi:hypothetical protein